MNVFQQIFAEVSPRASELLAEENENKSPNNHSNSKISTGIQKRNPKKVAKVAPIAENKPRKHNKSVERAPKEEKVVERPPAIIMPQKKVKKTSDDELVKYQLSQKESELDKDIKAKEEQLRKVLQEIEDVKKQIEEEKRAQKELSSNNQLLQEQIDNTETYEEKKARIQANFEAQLKEREQYWEDKVKSLN